MGNPSRKMLRKRKQFGRCSVKGHGDNCFCEICDEIQGSPFTRAQEKREVKREIEQDLKDIGN